MILSLDSKDLKEVDKIINSFVEKMADTTTSVPALGFCLQTLLNGRDELCEALGEEND